MGKIDYIVFIHRYYDSGKPKLGGLDYIIEYLLNIGKSVLTIESPLYPKIHKDIVVTFSTKEEKKLLLRFKTPFSNDILTWVTGVLIDVYMALRYKAKDAKALASDPLTSLPAAILKKIGYISFHYYHCTDYSEVRFKNNWMDAIYRLLRGISVKNADVVGCVSMKIYKKLNGLKHKQLFYIPNSPSFHNYEKYRLPIEKRDKNVLVLTCLGIIKRYKILESVKIFNDVWQKNKNLQFKIIGSLDTDKTYYSEVTNLLDTLECKNNVIFVGQVSRERNCEIIGKSYLGVCFYDETDSFSRYADSLKIREYAAMGIPCVADLVTSTAEEMQSWDAGVAVEKLDKAPDAINGILYDSKLYANLSSNSVKWAEKMDKDEILEEFINKYVGK